MRTALADRICAKVGMIDGPLGKYAGQFQSFLENQRYSQARIINIFAASRLSISS